MADTYARVIAAQTTKYSEQIHVLEIGAGHGKLSYLVALRLRELLPAAATPPVCVVCTDVNPEVIHSRVHLPLMQELIRQGWLDFSILDATDPRPFPPIQLLCSGKALTQSPGPTIVLANYVFDSLPADAIWSEGGKLYYLLVSSNAQTVLGLQLVPHLPEEFWAVEPYCRDHPGLHLLPVGAVQCIARLSASLGPVLVLVADAEHSVGNECSLDALPISPNPDCFTLPVQFDLLAPLLGRTQGVGGCLEKIQSPDLTVGLFGQEAPRMAQSLRASLWPLDPTEMDHLLHLATADTPFASTLSDQGFGAVMELCRFDHTEWRKIRWKLRHQKRIGMMCLETMFTMVAQDGGRFLREALQWMYATGLFGEAISFMERKSGLLEGCLRSDRAAQECWFITGLCYHRLERQVEAFRTIAEHCQYPRAQKWLSTTACALGHCQLK
eukprot:TRINITY_DN15163_c0_g1_i2.p1 TRINITY_DN15163_c0_g1~~TRINITY_DN15163_c0_g1_i2.p1  ORF type:complete len:441 (+),score=64.32 TRINITY_DN15163_c0_g1_i2:238-1560(+)